MTTTTVYPDSDTESNSVDGSAIGGDGSAAVTWTTLVNHVGTEAADSTVQVRVTFIEHATTDRWVKLERAILVFNNPAIGADTITAATLSVYGNSKGSAAGEMTMNVYTSAVATPTAIVAGDFNSFGTVAQADTGITQSNFNLSGFNDFVLNATGRGNIPAAAVSNFGLRDSTFDVPDSAPTHQGGGSDARMVGWSADEDAAGDRRPKLAITHSVAFTPKAIMF